MSVTVRDMMALNPPWRRAGRKGGARAPVRRRRPAAPVSRSWEGVSASLRGALIMASGLVLAGILGWGWSTLTNPRFLPITSIQVQGPFAHVSAPAVRAAIAPFVVGNFLTVDVRRVQQAAQTLPWVKHAEVRRVWPDAVHVTVTEQSPVARWTADALVNNAGEIFRPAPASFPSGLPDLQGPAGSGPGVVDALRNMRAIVAPLNVHITRLVLDERRAWSLTLDNGMQVLLGRSDGYQRLLKFVKFYRRAFHDRVDAVDKVDLRYSNGFAVSWKQGAKQ